MAIGPCKNSAIAPTGANRCLQHHRGAERAFCTVRLLQVADCLSLTYSCSSDAPDASASPQRASAHEHQFLSACGICSRARSGRARAARPDRRDNRGPLGCCHIVSLLSWGLQAVAAPAPQADAAVEAVQSGKYCERVWQTRRRPTRTVEVRSRRVSRGPSLRHTAGLSAQRQRRSIRPLTGSTRAH